MRIVCGVHDSDGAPPLGRVGPAVGDRRSRRSVSAVDGVVQRLNVSERASGRFVALYLCVIEQRSMTVGSELWIVKSRQQSAAARSKATRR